MEKSRLFKCYRGVHSKCSETRMVLYRWKGISEIYIFPITCFEKFPTNDVHFSGTISGTVAATPREHNTSTASRGGNPGRTQHLNHKQRSRELNIGKHI
jgi:hypothetical protein